MIKYILATVACIIHAALVFVIGITMGSLNFTMFGMGMGLTAVMVNLFFVALYSTYVMDWNDGNRTD